MYDLLAFTCIFHCIIIIENKLRETATKSHFHYGMTNDAIFYVKYIYLKHIGIKNKTFVQKLQNIDSIKTHVFYKKYFHCI